MGTSESRIRKDRSSIKKDKEGPAGDRKERANTFVGKNEWKESKAD
jgi:hypothetical protein